MNLHTDANTARRVGSNSGAARLMNTAVNSTVNTVVRLAAGDLSCSGVDFLAPHRLGLAAAGIDPQSLLRMLLEHTVDSLYPEAAKRKADEDEEADEDESDDEAVVDDDEDVDEEEEDDDDAEDEEDEDEDDDEEDEDEEDDEFDDPDDDDDDDFDDDDDDDDFDDDE